MPSPSPRDKNEHALEAKRRLKREVIHRLAYGNKVHSEMAEVHHVLTQRDNSILCEAGKVVNPDDASGAALEDALGDVAVRKQKSGSPDEWELHKDAWREYGRLRNGTFLNGVVQPYPELEMQLLCQLVQL